ncbi:flavin reductase family protein [Streptomyces sp. CA-132043]|uniref:flavin reductase family protein n=1 Tax=Streptomyces sp. CA-132043 TaxID=3240048 RepID=UPI003D89BF0A
MTTTTLPASGHHGTSAADPATGEQLRQVMRLFPTGVALLATGEGEDAVAMTINALMSVSLAPPQVVVSVRRAARAHPVLENTGAFTLHLLAGDQAGSASLFASPDKPAGPALAPYVAREVTPGALAVLDCRVEAVYPGGDHSLLLARVESARTVAGERPPLTFHHGAMTTGGRRG